MTAPQGPVSYQTQPPPEFSYEEYLAAVAAVLAAMAAVVGAIAAPYQSLRLTRSDWLSFLAATYPQVDSARQQIAELSRRFYDSERAKHIGPIEIPVFDETRTDILGPDGRPIDLDDETGLTMKVWPRLDMFLAPYEPDWYEEAMDAVVRDFIKEDVSDGIMARLIGFTVKEAENAGRRTALWAVDDDPDIVGWARVEGNENVGSCGFCAMLISRGPVYKEATDAGFDLDNPDAVEEYRQAQALGVDIPKELMTRWHPNCDCKVVPVFDRMNWPGRDQYEAMQDLWIDVTKDLPLGEDRLNAFRRRLERGDLPRKITRPALAA